MSTPAKLDSVSSSTVISLPVKRITLPADFAEARRRRRPHWNFRAHRQRRTVTPTAPVAPTIATTGRAIGGRAVGGRDWIAVLILVSIRAPETRPIIKRPRPWRGLPGLLSDRNQHANA